jgi:CheY-like chemotaxis protein
MAPVAISDIYEDAERAFRQMAEQKGLDFKVQIDPELPPSIVSDEQRLKQILKNLLSNAFKFTHSGDITLSIGLEPEGTAFDQETLRGAEQVASFTVSDTGVGIPEDKLGAIFEAFQQADGTTSRKYGGTGLGLSISRQIAWLLGGEIQVRSTPGAGSSFSLYLPLRDRALEFEVAELVRGASEVRSGGVPAPPAGATALADDPAALEADDRVVLVIDSDPERAAQMLDVVHAHGAKGILAVRHTAGLGLAREHRPEAIVLSGDSSRAESALGQLKKHPDTRHLPVVVIGDPVTRIEALRSGAAAFVEEPAASEQLADALTTVSPRAEPVERRIALITEAADNDDRLTDLLSAGNQVTLQRITAADALSALHAASFDLAVVAVGEERRSTVALLVAVAEDPILRERPLIAYLDTELPKAERARLDALSKTAVISIADSPERLVDRAALFLHRVEAQLPPTARKMLGELRTGDAPLQGRKVLVIDDDIRNVFALTSTLEQRGMKVVFAENGREGIDRLLQHPNTDLVLLDIMMPEMDGYETAQAIRSMSRFEHLPIISLTAKAMKGDREKSIAAGASDYITKPVDVDQLIAMMRVWLDA